MCGECGGRGRGREKGRVKKDKLKGREKEGGWMSVLMTMYVCMRSRKYV